MKRSLLLAGSVAMLACGTLAAQVRVNPGLRTNSPQSILNSVKMTEAPVRVPLEKNNAASTQTLSYQNMYQTDFFPQFETFTIHQVLVQEPKSGALFLVQNHRRFGGAGNTLDGGQVELHVSTNDGASWTESRIFDKTNVVFAMPSFAVANPNDESDPAKMMWFLYGFTYPGPTWARGSQLSLIKTTSSPFEFPLEGPENGNTAGYTWNYGSMATSAGTSPVTFFASELGVGTGNAQYGAYGIYAFDYASEDFVTSSMPSRWDLSNFRPSPNPASSYNAQIHVSTDPDGRVYAAVNNIFADDQENRVPAVSMSDDHGASWSTWNRLPVSALTAYRTEANWTGTIQLVGAYEQDGFTVTGENEWSYIMRLGEVQDNRWANIHVVEAYYKAGAWGIRRIAELNGFPIITSRQDSLSGGTDGAARGTWLTNYDGNPQGHEVEVARDAAGNILVKWIDENPAHGMFRFSSPVNIATFDQQNNRWNTGTLDSMMTTDMYYSYRKAGSTSWSPAINITNDTKYDKGTRIPAVIKSINKVPVIYSQGFTKAQISAQSPYAPGLQALPDILLETQMDYRTPNTIRYANFNAENPTSVEEQNPINYTFRFNGVTPNPATSASEVTFTLDRPGMVAVELYDVLGNKVRTLANGAMDTGVHGLTINAATISAGSYYVSLTVDGARITKPLVVVK